MRAALQWCDLTHIKHTKLTLRAIISIQSQILH